MINKEIIMKKILFCLICSLFLVQATLAQNASGAGSPAGGLSVNINTAEAEQIASILDGVGQKKAEAIVRFRESYGAFASADALAEVRGIGEATVEKNRHRIRIE